MTRTLIWALAQNQVPAGYGLHPAGRGERVSCKQPGVMVTTAHHSDSPMLPNCSGWAACSRVGSTIARRCCCSPCSRSASAKRA